MPSMEDMKIEDHPFYDSMMQMLQGFIDAVKNYGDCDVFAEKIAKWDKTKLMTQFMDVAEPMRCGFQILNHGDPWLNNIMFKSDADKKSIDVKLIDFQMSFWASPAADLLYFLITSVADDVKVEHFDNFIEFYHSELSSGLKKLEYKEHIPTLAELHIDLLDKGFFGEFVVQFYQILYLTFEVLSFNDLIEGLKLFNRNQQKIAKSL